MKNNKPDISLIRKYLNGDLDARAMYELERLAQNDPALMDVMMGMEMGNSEKDTANLSDIDALINQRVQGGKVKRMFPWKTWAIAASLVIGISAVAVLTLQKPGQTLLIQVKNNTGQKSVANEDTGHKQVPVIKEKLPVTNQTAAVLKPGFSRRKPVSPDISAEILNPSSPEAKLPLKVTVEAGTVALASAKPRADSVIHDPNSLNEVAVVGYGTQKKMGVTAAASTTIKADPVTTDKALAGRVAGVMIDQNSAPIESKPVYVIKGVVTDEMSVPIPGVSVRLANGHKGTSTDVNGKFSIELPSKDEALQVGMIGFRNREVKVKDLNTLNIALQPDNNVLSEVVVTAYGAKKKQVAEISKTQPAAGWEAYKEYLKANAAVGDGKAGKVTLAFTIGAGGTPVNIRIVKSANGMISQKATQLILNGPKWIAGKNELTKEIILKIRFQNQ